jgi:hypothetical protein
MCFVRISPFLLIINPGRLRKWLGCAISFLPLGFIIEFLPPLNTRMCPVSFCLINMQLLIVWPRFDVPIDGKKNMCTEKT